MLYLVTTSLFNTVGNLQCVDKIVEYFVEFYFCTPPGDLLMKKSHYYFKEIKEQYTELLLRKVLIYFGIKTSIHYLKQNLP